MDTSPVLPQANWLGAPESLKHSIPLTGYAAPGHFPTHPPTCLPHFGLLGPAPVRLYCVAGKGRLSQLSQPSLTPTREAAVGASSELSFLLTGGPAVRCSLGTTLPIQTAQQHHHYCRAGRGQPLQQHPRTSMTVGSQKPICRDATHCLPAVADLCQQRLTTHLWVPFV